MKRALGSLFVVGVFVAAGVGCSVLLDFDKLRGGHDQGVVVGDLAGADLTGVVEDLAGADLTGPDLAGSCKPGSVSFAVTSTPAFSGAASPSTLAVGRFNGDARDDVAVLNSGTGTVSVYLGQMKGAGSPLQPATVPPQCPPFPSDPVSALDLVVADVNSDSQPDIVVLCQGSDVSVAKAFLMPLQSRGDGSFTALTPSPVVGATVSARMAAGRFAVHANNAVDIAISSYLDASQPGGFTFFGDGAGGFALGPSLPVMYYPFLIAAGKITAGDAYDDLLLVDYNQGWLVRNTDGAWPGTIPAVTPLTRMPFGPAVDAHVVAIADVDGDLRGDVVWTADSQVSIFRNTDDTHWPASGDGSGVVTEIDTQTISGIGLATIGMGVRDLDCDGRADLVVVGLDVDNHVGARILMANAAAGAEGTFTAIGATIPIGTFTSPGTVTFGDFDGDGDVDILVSAWDGNQTGEGWIIANLAVP